MNEILQTNMNIFPKGSSFLFNVINASDISSNTLTQAQYDLITNGRPTLIKGNLFSMDYILIVPMHEGTTYWTGNCLATSIYGQGENGIFSIQKSNLAISLTRLTTYDRNGTLYLKDKSFPNYPSSPANNQVLTYKTDNTMAWLDPTTLTIDVPLNQCTIAVLKDAITNINGYSPTGYTSVSDTITTGGQSYAVKRIKYNSSNCTQAQASTYMKAMCGSEFVPTYNASVPQNTIFMLPDGTLWKPQFDSTNGLVLWAMQRVMRNPMTTAGDIIYADSNGNAQRLAKGFNNSYLGVDQNGNLGYQQRPQSVVGSTANGNYGFNFAWNTGSYYIEMVTIIWESTLSGDPLWITFPDIIISQLDSVDPTYIVGPRTSSGLIYLKLTKDSDYIYGTVRDGDDNIITGGTIRYIIKQ